MQEIANTPAHTLAVDPTKNRIYCTMTGNGLPEPSAFIQDWKKATRLVAKGFTVLVDVTRFRITSLKWMEIATKTQVMLLEAGLARTAEIVPEEVFLTLQFNRILDGCWLEEKKMFTNRNEAEAWLDRIPVVKW